MYSTVTVCIRFIYIYTHVHIQNKLEEPFPQLTFHSIVILSIPFTVVERMSGSNSGAEIKTKILTPRLICSVSYGVMIGIIIILNGLEGDTKKLYSTGNISLYLTKNDLVSNTIITYPFVNRKRVLYCYFIKLPRRTIVCSNFEAIQLPRRYR